MPPNCETVSQLLKPPQEVWLAMLVLQDLRKTKIKYSGICKILGIESNSLFVGSGSDKGNKFITSYAY